MSYVGWNLTGAIHTYEFIGAEKGSINVENWPLAETNPPEAKEANLSSIIELETKGDYAHNVVMTVESSTYSGWAQGTFQVYLRNN